MTRLFTFAIVALLAVPASAEETPYRLQPGDLLDISIWGEDAMHRQVSVRPDGMISYPLVGHISVIGMAPKDAEDELKRRLVEGSYYVNPALTIAVVEARGNQVFVTGRVRNPGAIIAPRRIDVMQALSLAGGPDEFAHEGGIIVLRRKGDQQEVYRFDYAAVRSGRDLSKNILLEAGDVVVVPEVGFFTGLLP